jgi:acyl-CoA synthetase (NDP forming)
MKFTSKKILKAYGLGNCSAPGGQNKGRSSPAEPGNRFSVVLKIHSPIITHKSDCGRSSLDLEDEHKVEAAFDVSWPRSEKELLRPELKCYCSKDD